MDGHAFWSYFVKVTFCHFFKKEQNPPSSSKPEWFQPPWSKHPFLQNLSMALSKGLQSLLDFWMKTFSQYSSNASSAGGTECFSWSPFITNWAPKLGLLLNICWTLSYCCLRSSILCSFWLTVCCSDKFGSIAFNFFLVSEFTFLPHISSCFPLWRYLFGNPSLVFHVNDEPFDLAFLVGINERSVLVIRQSE